MLHENTWTKTSNNKKFPITLRLVLLSLWSSAQMSTDQFEILRSHTVLAQSIQIWRRRLNYRLLLLLLILSIRNSPQIFCSFQNRKFKKFIETLENVQFSILFLFIHKFNENMRNYSTTIHSSRLKVLERSFSGDIRCCQTKAKLFYRLSKPNSYIKDMIQENNPMHTNDLKSYKRTTYYYTYHQRILYCWKKFTSRPWMWLSCL